MPCDDLKIHLYSDGELDPEQQQAVRDHMRTCAACRQLHQQLQWLDSALRDTPRPTLAARARPVRPRPWLAALAASLMVGWLGWSSGNLPVGVVRPAEQRYRVELAGAPHEISVHGGELLELAVGEDKPQSINLERARIR